MQAELPPKTIAEGVFLRLREDILRCRLLPGHRLRLEMLRDAYGVGMSPLREALSRLTSMGLVTAEGQRGFTVAPISIGDLLDLTKSRAWIETLALRFAMATGDRNWEAELLAAAHRLSGSPVYDAATGAANEVWHRSHRAFHATLVTVPTTPPQLLRFREHLYDLSDRYRRLSGELSKSERDIAGEHQALTAAALSRDTSRASELMVEHLVCTTKLILNKQAETADRAEQVAAELMEDICAGMTGATASGTSATVAVTATAI